MDIISSIKSVKYVHSLLAGDRENILNYPYVPQKPECIEKEQTMPLPRVTPEQVGISSAYVFDFFEELCSKTDVNGHNILMMRNGKVFAQGEFSPYRKEVWHVTHSLCKSITAMAIGMLIDEGKLSLDDKVCEILKVKSFLAQASVVRKLTVENLLCMSSGVDYGEIAIIAENDWLNGFFKAGVEFEPGKRFAYNSMNTYLLSCIVKTVSGEGLIDYLTPRLLKPLGITNIAWEKSSKDIEKGGWGLYLTIEDAAKLGQLLLQGGKWTVDGKEQQILSQAFVKTATTTHIEKKDNRTNIEYGYQIWTRKSDGMFQFNGMLGQYVFVLPKQNMVIAMNAGCCNLANESSALSLFDKYFANVEVFGDRPLKKNSKENKRLLLALDNLKYQKPFFVPKMNFIQWYQKYLMQKSVVATVPEIANILDGKSYTMQDNVVGLLPLVLQCMNGNMGKGTQKIEFQIQENELVMAWQENAIKYCLPLVEGISREFVLDYNGEKFLASTISHFYINDDDFLVAKITVALLESSCARKIKFVFNGDSIAAFFDEDPNIDNILGNIIMGENWQLELLDLKDKAYAKFRLAQILTPAVEGTLADTTEK